MKLKNIKTYDDFLNEKNNNINESILGKMFKFLGGKLLDYAKKIKVAKKIDPIIASAKEDIESLFKQKNLVEDFKKSINDKKNIDSENHSDDKDKEDNVIEESIVDNMEEHTKTKDTSTKDSKEAENELDKAINTKIKLTHKKIEPYIKNKKGEEIFTAKMYAQLKMVELEEDIIKKKIDFLVNGLKMSEKDANNEYSDKMKKIQNKQKESMKKLDEELAKNEDHNKELKKGDVYNYETKDGKKEKIVISDVNDRGEVTAKRISSNDDAEAKTPAKEIGDDFNPLTNKITSIGKEYIEDVKKTFSELISPYLEEIKK